MKNIIAISIFLALSFAVNACYSNVQFPEALEKELLALPDKEAYDFFAKAVARQKNQLPKKVNSYISWTDITIEDKQISNIYIVDEEKLNIPLSAALAELKGSGKTNVLSRVKSNPMITIMVKRGYKMAYQYFDKNKKLLHQFFITQDDLM